jgi:hypothetical protein
MSDAPPETSRQACSAMMLRDRDLTDQSLEARRELLEQKILPALRDPVRYARSFRDVLRRGVAGSTERLVPGLRVSSLSSACTGPDSHARIHLIGALAGGASHHQTTRRHQMPAGDRIARLRSLVDLRLSGICGQPGEHESSNIGVILVVSNERSGWAKTFLGRAEYGIFRNHHRPSCGWAGGAASPLGGVIYVAW